MHSSIPLTIIGAAAAASAAATPPSSTVVNVWFPVGGYHGAPLPDFTGMMASVVDVSPSATTYALTMTCPTDSADASSSSSSSASRRALFARSSSSSSDDEDQGDDGECDFDALTFTMASGPQTLSLDMVDTENAGTMKVDIQCSLTTSANVAVCTESVDVNSGDVSSNTQAVITLDSISQSSTRFPLTVTAGLDKLASAAAPGSTPTNAAASASNTGATSPSRSGSGSGATQTAAPTSGTTGGSAASSGAGAKTTGPAGDAASAAGRVSARGVMVAGGAAALVGFLML